MKNILKYALSTAILFGLASCEDDEQNVTDLVQETVERGAVLRTIDFTDEFILDVDEGYSIEFEVQDPEGGDLLESISIAVTFTDNSTLAGDTSGATAGPVSLITIPAADFMDGPFGLPRTTYSISIEDLTAAVGLTTEDIYVADTFRFSETLTLTDGRVFDQSNAGGIITAGFFNSPFQHVYTVSGGIDLSFVDEGANEVNIVPGSENEGYSATAIIEEAVEDLWTEVQIFSNYQDNTVEDDDTDFTTEEMLIATIDREMFMDSLDDDGMPLDFTLENSVSFTLDEISGGVMLEDMEAGDEILIRYVVINLAGRAISDTEEPFTVSVPVITCEVPPLTVNTLDMFTGIYITEQASPSIFGYDTFGEGTPINFVSIITPAEFTVPGLALGNIQRAFQADYLLDAGFGNTRTFVIELNCMSATFAQDGGPVEGETGLVCVQDPNPIILGGIPGAGSFDSTDDSEFTLVFTDDLLEDCGDSITASIKFIKQ